jgi:hypothetical protein
MVPICRPGLIFRPGCHAPVQDAFNPARTSIIRPGKVHVGLATYNPAQAAVYLLFKYTCTYNSTYILYISHNKGVLWHTRGYIPDISPPRLWRNRRVMHRLQHKYTKVPKTHMLMKLICWSSRAISKYYSALFGYIDTLPLRLCLIDIVCFDNAGILICLLGCFCLLRYFASLGFISTLCLSGYVSSTLSTLTMPVY